MKKLISYILSVSIICLTAVNVLADKVSGRVFYTDIVAYINGLPIRSFNIDGYTGIVAEDLRAYGFEVYWEPELRALYVSYQGGEATADYTPRPSAYSSGTFAFNIYETDIKTYVMGREVTAFNIGGETIIYIDDLADYGKVEWFENERKICFSYVEQWEVVARNDDGDISKNIDGFSVNFTRNENGSFDISGENIQYLTNFYISGRNKIDSFGFSLYQNIIMQTANFYGILGSMYTIDDNLDVNTIKPVLEEANKYFKITINEEPVVINGVKPGKGNGHSDYDFSLDTTLGRDDIQKMSIVFDSTI